MELTGKCKEDFEKWLNFNENGNTKDRFNHWLGWDRLTDSMQWGVYEDFFDGKGIFLSTSGLILSKTFYWDISIKDNVEFFGDNHKTRDEARTTSIEKANKIYNGINGKV